MDSSGLEQIRTDNGTLYEFHGDDSSTGLSLSNDFQDFSRFLDLCVSAPREAENLLRHKNVSDKEIVEILTRYGKEARRLQTDLKHERERKLLSIRQRLEAELADAMPPDTEWKVIERLVEVTLPNAVSIGAAYTIDQKSLNSDGGLANLTINLNPQIIHEVKGIVAHEIRGDASVSEEDEKLLELVQQYAGGRAVELASAVHELSDPGIPGPKRLISAQKLRAFIIGIGSRLGEIGINVLQRYIENRLQMK